MTGKLPSTERVNPKTDAIDRVATLERVRMLIDAHEEALDAARSVEDAIVRAINVVVTALQVGRRVVVVGAGTSGRLAVLDASELPPTFGFPPDRYEGRIAGGDTALRRSVEGAEDDPAAGAQAVADLAPDDVLIGVSASGGAAFVHGAIVAARDRGVRTIALVNALDTPLAQAAEVAIEALTGAEPIAGSTRLRAGTAQKIILNTISTAAMIALGKTYRNRMIDVVASNAKLRARAERLVREFAGDVDVPAFLAASGGSVKLAIVMARRGVARSEAQRLLDAAGGRLARVIDDA
jgi:N-acetylmuramic acid 6-phosphate etherase